MKSMEDKNVKIKIIDGKVSLDQSTDPRMDILKALRELNRYMDGIKVTDNISRTALNRARRMARVIEDIATNRL